MNKLLLCLGMPRCATTWLHRQLILHPKISGIPRKEIHYFLSNYGEVDRLSDKIRVRMFKRFVETRQILPESENQELTNRELEKIYQENLVHFAEDLNWYLNYLQGPVSKLWYERLFDNVPDDHWAVDFSTTNGMVSPQGFESMAQAASTTRATLTLRHPIDRLWSHINLHAKVTGGLPSVSNWSVEEVVDFVEKHSLVERAFYAPVVENALEHFGENALQILNYDDVMTSPSAVVSSVFDLLNLDMDGHPLAQKRLPTRTKRALERNEDALDLYLDPFISDLESVRALGVTFVDPWLEDLSQRKAQENHRRSNQSQRRWFRYRKRLV